MTSADDSNIPASERDWAAEYRRQVGAEKQRRNRSGLTVDPLYTPADWDAARYAAELGNPGQYPLTRGIHASMYRGRPWSQRLIVGLGLPEDYNARMRELYASGSRGLYLAPCNSHMRGYDADEVHPQLLGTCGTVVNTVEDLEICLRGLPYDTTAISLGDTAPFTLSAMLLVLAKRQGISWEHLSGTTNQSDYLSHYAALHMFLRLSLGGSRRLLLDHVEFMARHVPRWHPLSVVGQHMQQAGATPAQAMGFALCSAMQHADDLVARGLAPDGFLPRLSFFFDVSISFFEEIAKFRAGRRIWSAIARERYGARDPRSLGLRFHAQTSGTDLTRQEPHNNIVRVAVQAMAAIFGGAQSLHTDAFDEALSSPSAAAARIAINTQNILREEAQLDAVIDPLGGGFFLEAHTNDMERAIRGVMDDIAQAGGMYAAVESGRVQQAIGQAALAFQDALDSGSYHQVAVNSYRSVEAEVAAGPTQARLSPADVERQLSRLRAWRAARGQDAYRAAIDTLARALDDPRANAYAAVVGAVEAGATHGEICHAVRKAVGEGMPLITL